MRYLFAILFLMTTVTAFGQSTDRAMIQFSGVTYYTNEPKAIVPYVNITNLTTKKQVYISNYQGYFSFVAHERDSLLFTSVGYRPYKMVVPANNGKTSLLTDIQMEAQITNLPTVHIFPWATVDEFRKDFLALKIADDALEIARKNLSAESIRAAKASMPRTAREGFSIQDFHNNVVNSHSLTNPLLNPLAWGSLVRDIAAGDKSNAAN